MYTKSMKLLLVMVDTLCQLVEDIKRVNSSTMVYSVNVALGDLRLNTVENLTNHKLVAIHDATHL